MPNHTTLESLFTDIADAIREKTGGTDELVADNFPDSIREIQTGSSAKYGNGIGQISTFELAFRGQWNPNYGRGC